MADRALRRPEVEQPLVAVTLTDLQTALDCVASAAYYCCLLCSERAQLCVAELAVCGGNALRRLCLCAAISGCPTADAGQGKQTTVSTTSSAIAPSPLPSLRRAA